MDFESWALFGAVADVRYLRVVAGVEVGGIGIKSISFFCEHKFLFGIDWWLKNRLFDGPLIQVAYFACDF